MYEQFEIKKGDVITITGAGGKTSLLFSLAQELSTIGKVAVTTTTKIYLPNPCSFEQLFTKDIEIKGSAHNIFVLGSSVENGKITSLTYDEIERLKKIYDFILIEGDGAKEKLLKEWNDREPCIPNFSNKVIGVINMDIFDKKIDEDNIHRFELFSKKFSNYLSSTINEKFLVEYIEKAGYFRNSPNSEKFIFFNGIDGSNYLEKFSIAIEVANELTKFNFKPKLLFGSVNEHIIFPYIPVTAIVMASGFSRRMGQDKLKLKYRGISLLENVLEKITFANFYQVIVCGRDKWTEEITKLYNFQYVENKNAHLGQSESIKLGIKNATGKAFVFFTGDQVLITSNTIEKLYYNFEKYGYITIPQSNGNRFSPVFFPETKKNELLLLEGDTGGREVIKNTPLLSIVDFPYDNEFLDIDTSEDYLIINSNSIIKNKS